MLKLNSIMIGTTQLEAMGSFYANVLGKPADMVNIEDFYGWRFGDVFVAVFTHSEMTGNAREPGRLMLNYETTEVKQEFARIRDLGARVISEPYAVGDGWVATFADPDGNYFQLVTPSLH